MELMIQGIGNPASSCGFFCDICKEPLDTGMIIYKRSRGTAHKDTPLRRFYLIDRSEIWVGHLCQECTVRSLDKDGFSIDNWRMPEYDSGPLCCCCDKPIGSFPFFCLGGRPVSFPCDQELRGLAYREKNPPEWSWSKKEGVWQ